MDLDAYKNDGWGLSRRALASLLDIVDTTLAAQHTVRIVEFGSGSSTRFFVDLVLQRGLQERVQIVSFDNDRRYMPQFDAARTDAFLALHERPLAECDDNAFERMFSQRRYDPAAMRDKTSPLDTQQRNNFYALRDGDLDGRFDLVVLDGPHGNGRSLAFLHALPHIGVGTHVLIDDHTHYDFADRLLQLTEATEVVSNRVGKPGRWDKLRGTVSSAHRESISPWHTGGEFVIYRVDALVS
ncbi:MAG: class I SAM-dependent methyltransferase [Pseudomonadota bacterium]